MPASYAEPVPRSFDSALLSLLFSSCHRYSSCPSNDVLEKYVSGYVTDAEAPFLLPAGSGGE